jgi:hypothetical protein
MNKWYFFGGFTVFVIVGIAVYTNINNEVPPSISDASNKVEETKNAEVSKIDPTLQKPEAISKTNSKQPKKLSKVQRTIASKNPNANMPVYDKTLDEEEIIDNPAVHSQKIYNEMNKYPLTNTKIASKEADPVFNQYKKDVRIMRNPDNPDYSLEVYSQKNYFIKGEKIDIRAKLKKNGSLIKGEKIQAMISYNEQFITSKPVILKDTNGDNEYELTFTADNAFGKKLEPGSYEVIIVWEDKLIGKKGTMGETISFVYSDPGARLTGNYKDEIVDGSLIISAEVVVSKKSLINLEASVYTTNDKPIVAVQNGMELEKGKHWIPLKVYGLILHEQKLSGPFVLKNITLTKTSNPPMRGRLVTPGYNTSEYQWGQFTDKSFDSLKKQNQSLSKM